MDDRRVVESLAGQLEELIEGAAEGGYVMNAGDVGLLASLDRLSAGAASASHAGGASVAGHANHLRFALALMQRRLAGETPEADWVESWRVTTVDDEEWERLRGALRDEAQRVLAQVRALTALNQEVFERIVGDTMHLAYHVGAIRQIDRGTRGPAAS